jgi:branched-chain amino acid transport system permease protein
MILSLVIDGLAVGSIYALVSVGLVLLVRSTGALNFAHGDFMMFSTFIAYAFVVQFKFPFWLSIICTLILAALLGVVAERLVIRRLMSGPMSGIIMGTLGISYILQGIAKDVWSDDVYTFPAFFPAGHIRIGTALISPQNIGIILSALVIISVLYLFLGKTKVGTGLRALTQNKTAAMLMGIRITRIYSLSWAVGIMLAAIAGVLLAPTLYLSTGMGAITFTGIIAAIIGGFGNMFGAIIGGYLLGILTSVLPLYIPTKLQGIIPFALLMIVLFIKPTGILGKREVKKV